MKNENILKLIKGKLIVSCQALEEEPLHSPYIMSKMAVAAMQGGASGIRSNSYEDIKAIKNIVDLPIIGLVKRIYSDSEIYITPTVKEVDEIISAGADILAMDATSRLRPNGVTLEEFYGEIRERYKDIIIMADISNYEEGVEAEKLGFDIVGTTLCGYTSYTEGTELPNYDLIGRLVKKLKIPVIAEGGICYPYQLKKVINMGIFSAVVGTAITRPMDITKKFVSVI